VTFSRLSYFETCQWPESRDVLRYVCPVQSSVSLHSKYFKDVQGHVLVVQQRDPLVIASLLVVIDIAHINQRIKRFFHRLLSKIVGHHDLLSHNSRNFLLPVAIFGYFLSSLWTHQI